MTERLYHLAAAPFEAARRVDVLHPGHRAARLHGHSFLARVRAQLPEDWAAFPGGETDALTAALQDCVGPLDYRSLNDIPGLENPTSERLSAWLWGRLKPALPELSWVTVYETSTAGCHYDGAHYRIWKESKFESALKLVRAPAGDPRRRLHGHSYLVRLHLTAPLDTVLGWTVDYGDVKELFKPVYQALDHHTLNDLPGLTDTGPGSVVRWVRAQVAPVLPPLDRVDLYATPGCGAMLVWGENGPALPT